MSSAALGGGSALFSSASIHFISADWFVTAARASFFSLKHSNIYVQDERCPRIPQTTAEQEPDARDGGRVALAGGSVQQKVWMMCVNVG